MEKDVSGDFMAWQEPFLHQVYFNHAYNTVIDKYGGNYLGYM